MNSPFTKIRESLFGAGGQTPTTIGAIEEALAKCDREILVEDASAREHSQTVESIRSELALTDSPEFSARLERAQRAADAALERGRNLRATRNGLARRRGELLAQQAAAERAAFVADVNRKGAELVAIAGRIDEAQATLGLLWNEMLTAASQLQATMPSAGGRELAISMPTLIALRPRAEQPSVRAVAIDLGVVALRAIGAEQSEEGTV